MAHNTYYGVNGVSRYVGKMYVGVDGVARKVVKAYIGIDGIARLFFEDGGSVALHAMLYDDGSFVFQSSDVADSGKTLVATYSLSGTTEYANTSKVPWNSNMQNIKSVGFENGFSATSISYWFDNAKNLTTFNFTGFDISMITNMVNTYYNCSNLTGSPICGNNVTNMSSTYYKCSNLTGTPVCGNNVTNMSYTYYYCFNLTGSPVCGSKVTSMAYTYTNCQNITGTPVCGSNVTNLYFAYSDCFNIMGDPVCGDKVIQMGYAYNGCSNLTGIPVCGNNVKYMYGTYKNCVNLTGHPVCGNNVTNMYEAYRGCSNLTGSPVCGNKVNNMCRTYYDCKNLSGNAYFYSNNVSDVWNCFYNRYASNRLNIYVVSGSKTNKTVHYTNAHSLVGAAITWTDAGTYQYNTTYNIYIYPVENVAAAREANGD